MPRLLDPARSSAAPGAESLLARAAELERLISARRRDAERQGAALARLRGVLAVIRTGSQETAASLARLSAALEAAAAPRPSRPLAARSLAVLWVVAAFVCSAPPRVEPAMDEPLAAAPSPAYRPFPANAPATPAESEALRLVYGLRLRGSGLILLDALAGSETPGGPPPWSIEPVNESVFALTYAPEGYEFEADVARGTATPSAETRERLNLDLDGPAL